MYCWLSQKYTVHTPDKDWWHTTLEEEVSLLRRVLTMTIMRNVAVDNIQLFKCERDERRFIPSDL